MILMYPEKLSSVSADTEDGSFPASYMEMTNRKGTTNRLGVMPASSRQLLGRTQIKLLYSIPMLRVPTLM